MNKAVLSFGRRQRIVRRVTTRYRRRGVRDADTVLASYPRSGNTWLKFMVAELLSGETVDFESSDDFVPELGRHQNARRLLPDRGRVIKTHEEYETVGLPDCRALYVVRDGRDVAVSEYFFRRRVGSFQGEFAAFLPQFLQGKVNSYGSWSDHVRSWVDSAHAGLLVINYEELIADTVTQLAKLAEFLGIEPASAERLQSVVAHNSADTMRQKEQDSPVLQKQMRDDIPFVRSATAGDWRNHFDSTLESLFEDEAGQVLAELGYQ